MEVVGVGQDGGFGWCGAAARACHNKGFARRPQEFLAWEEGDWEGMVYEMTEDLEGAAPRRGRATIKVSQGARRSSWPGRWEAVCRDSCIWRWWEWGSRRKEV